MTRAQHAARFVIFQFERIRGSIAFAICMSPIPVQWLPVSLLGTAWFYEDCIAGKTYSEFSDWLDKLHEAQP